MMKIKRLVSVCTMTVMLACCGFSASARELFTDVPESERAAPYIYNLADRGIIGGSGRRFVLAVERGSKMRICKNACQYYRDSDCSELGLSPYSDVPYGEWFFPYVNASTAYMTGFQASDGTLYFSPTESASREDVAVSMVRLSDWTYQSTQTPTDFLPQGLGTGRTFHHLTARIYALRWITEL